MCIAQPLLKNIRKLTLPPNHSSVNSINLRVDPSHPPSTPKTSVNQSPFLKVLILDPSSSSASCSMAASCISLSHFRHLPSRFIHYSCFLLTSSRRWSSNTLYEFLSMVHWVMRIEAVLLQYLPAPAMPPNAYGIPPNGAAFVWIMAKKWRQNPKSKLKKQNTKLPAHHHQTIT